MDLLERLREHYPSFKLSAFTIPYDFEYEDSQFKMMRPESLARVQASLDWIQIIPHGLLHTPREFEYATREAMEAALKGIEERFTADALPYEHGFCAPFWLWTQDVVDVLDREGWWGAIDRNQPDMLAPKRSYTYSHSIDEPFWEANVDTLKLHGHMTRPSANNLEDCFVNLLKLPSDVEWCYVTDFIDETSTA